MVPPSDSPCKILGQKEHEVAQSAEGDPKPYLPVFRNPFPQIHHYSLLKYKHTHRIKINPKGIDSTKNENSLIKYSLTTVFRSQDV